MFTGLPCGVKPYGVKPYGVNPCGVNPSGAMSPGVLPGGLWGRCRGRGGAFRAWGPEATQSAATAHCCFARLSKARALVVLKGAIVGGVREENDTISRSSACV